MDRKICLITAFFVLIFFLPCCVCLAGTYRSALAPYLKIERNNVQDFFGLSSEVESFLPLVRDIKGLRILMHRAVIEKDVYAAQILDSLASHPVPYVRTLFVKALVNSNPQMVFGSDFWQQRLLSDQNPVVLSEVKRTKAALTVKKNILDGVAHNFRNKLVSAGGFVRRIVKLLYARTLANELELQADDYKKAVALFQRDVFYKLKLEFDDDKTTDLRREEILSELNAMIGDQNIADISLESLESVIYKANESYEKRKETEKISVLHSISKSIEKTVNELNFEFQGSDDELVYFVVDKFAYQIGQLMDAIEQLQDMFKEDGKINTYLRIVKLETSYLQELVNNLQKAIGIEDLRLKKQDLKQIIKECEARFDEEYKDKNASSQLDLMPSEIDAVVSSDFPELLYQAFKVIDLFVTNDAEAVVYTKLRRTKDNAELTLEYRGRQFEGNELDLLVENILEPFTGVHTLEAYDAQSALLRIRNVVRACGGTIRVRKTEEGGLAFVITLPLHKEYAFVNKTVSRLFEVLSDSVRKIRAIKGSSLLRSEAIAEEDRIIIEAYERNLMRLYKTVMKYLRAMISFGEMLNVINKDSVNILSAYEGLASLSGSAVRVGEELQSNGLLEVSLLMNILIPSYHSMVMIDVKEFVQKIIDEHVEQRIDYQTNEKPVVNVSFHSSFGRIGANIATYPTELRMLLGELIDAVLQNGKRKMNIDMYLENRRLIGEIVIPYAPDRDKFNYNLSLINAIQERTGAHVEISSDVEGKSIKFLFSLPVTADLQRAPLDEDISEYLGESGKTVLILSGLLGSRRNNTSHLIESMLGLKKINVGFWMRVITYYISEEKPEVFNRINRLGKDISDWSENVDKENQEKINSAESEISDLIETECVPYIKELLDRIDFLAEPITIDGKDTAAVLEDSNLSIRDKIKVFYTNPANRKFLYKFTNNLRVQQVVDANLWRQVEKILSSDLYNGVIIIATDPKEIPENLKSIAHNFYLNAPPAVRAKILQQHADALVEWDRFTGKDKLEMEAIRDMAYELDVAGKEIDMNVLVIAQKILDILKTRNSDHLSEAEQMSTDVFHLVGSAI